MEKKTSVTAVIKKMGIVFLCLFFFDCACTGSGRYVTVGPLTPRILLAGLIMLCAAVPFFVNIEKQIKNPVNWLILIPVYMSAFHMDLSGIIGMATKTLPFVDTEWKLLLFVTAPFNLLKGFVIALITWLIYKPLSPILHVKK